jgi:transcriptional repressor NrdR
MAGKPTAERESGLPCPRCGNVRSRVTETRAAAVGSHKSLRRRRVCQSCGHRWWTHELAEEAAAPLESGGARVELRRALAALSEVRQAVVAFDRRTTHADKEV